MKKPIFITLVILLSLIIAGSVGYAGYTTYNYTQTLDDFEAMEAQQAIFVNDADAYQNPADRTKDATLKAEDYSRYTYVYQRDNIHFLSNVDAWNENLLAKLADELYANKHGEEINYVSEVILNAGVEDHIIGSQESIKKTFEIPMSLYNFLPVSSFHAKTMLSEINLYKADERTTVEDMAVVLSHEYGHHFTNHYFGLTFSNSDKETHYYELRGEGLDNVRLTTGSYDVYLDNHMWFLNELAAEDYVYFMGSENAHRIVEFYDTAEQVRVYARYGEDALNDIKYAYALCRNGTPHENITMGLPSDIEGLEEYFYSFIDDEPPVYEQRNPLGTLNLQMVKTNTKEHKFTWDQPYKGSDVIYTLILYDETGEAMCMVKTTDGSENGVAQFGYYKYKITKGNWIYTYSFGWDLDIGRELTARVSVTFPDGSVMLSDPLDFQY